MKFKKYFIAVFLVFFSCVLLTASFTDNRLWKTSIGQWFLKNKTWVTDGINASFSVNGLFVAVCRTNQTLEIVRLSDQKKVKIFDFSMMDMKKYSYPEVVSFSPNKLYFAVAFNSRRQVIILDRNKEKVIHRISLKFEPRYLRFSPRGRFLMIGKEQDADTYLAIYDLYNKRFFYNRNIPIIGDFTRSDRYFYLYKFAATGGRVICLNAFTRRVVRRIPMGKISGLGRLLSIRVLRSHRIALGFSNALYIAKRFLTGIDRTYFPGNINIRYIRPSHDSRLLIIGNNSRKSILNLYLNKTININPKEQTGNLSFYPAGNFLLYSDKKNRITKIRKLGIFR
ncbi:MAG: hypothetical protein KAR07_11585 [Spirochaetes bacterium]|nr:hypothetical protein [Spirochaetota bacterium]MCK5268809.1 hypothetical protein [Spirochaetota bacterium]